MPAQKTVTVYKFDELSDEAKETAREWWREQIFQDSSDWEFVYDDAVRMGKMLGITIPPRNQKCHVLGSKGKPGRDFIDTSPSIYFSGFSSQGDGACFEGTYKPIEDAAARIRQETNNTETELIRIAEALYTLQQPYETHSLRLVASITHSGRYSHSGTMSAEVKCVNLDGDECDAPEHLAKRAAEDDEKLERLMRDFADWIYKSLEKEYRDQMSDEHVDESIISNEYDFTADGKRYRYE